MLLLPVLCICLFDQKIKPKILNLKRICQISASQWNISFLELKSFGSNRYYLYEVHSTLMIINFSWISFSSFEKRKRSHFIHCILQLLAFDVQLARPGGQISEFISRYVCICSMFNFFLGTHFPFLLVYSSNLMIKATACCFCECEIQGD